MADLSLFNFIFLCLPFLFMACAAQAEVFTNRLAREKSPYLLQHARNPVDWYPWGEEAFSKAKSEGKPILLSIGYSTCHWCHVMEDESFSNAETAALMNRDFVAIKVDREERPDIDSVYMSYVMATTGSGGWPMTVFLTPERKPFYGGTYFPPEDRFGIPGFKTLLASIAGAWKSRRDEIERSADSAAQFLAAPRESARGKLTGETLAKAFERHASSFDAEWGGFGRAPKFPRSPALSLLLRHHRRMGEKRALEMAEKTLEAMARGGMYDQVGGGFHRYSTDRRWFLPHFEKMLYDQALLVWTYLEAFQATGKVFYSKIARETLDYVMREMTSSEGGFFSAEDADSLDPAEPGKKREGAFYVWKKEELEALLGEEEKIFSFHYGVAAVGNVEQDPHQEFTGRNVLWAAHAVEETAKEFKKSMPEVERILENAKSELLRARSRRPAPHLDDKVLADWNGLMIASFASASRVLDEPRYRDAAVKAADFILKKLKKSDGTLLHRWRDGEAAIPGNLNDYAFVIFGFLQAYEATFDERWLAEAAGLADKMIELFGDGQGGGFYLTARNAEALVARPKEVYDGAVPSGNSMAALDLMLLNRYTGDSRLRKSAEETLSAFAGEVEAEPTAYPQMLMALDFMLGPSAEIVIASEKEDAAVRGILSGIYGRFMPNKVVLFHKPGAAIERLAPFLKEQVPLNGKTTLYVCRNFTCERPAAEPEKIKELLQRI